MARKKAAKSSDSAAPHDQREAQRFTLILRAGKLVTDQGEFLCVLRDVSSGGLKLKLFHPLPSAPDCQIELAGGERYSLELAWQDGDQVGYRFAAGPVDIHQLLEETGPFPKRSIRIHLARPLKVALHGGDLILAAHLRDISQHGAALSCDARLLIGQQVALAADQLGTIDARIRWRRGDIYGVVFQQSFRLDVLARLTAQLQGHEPGSAAPNELARVNH